MGNHRGFLEAVFAAGKCGASILLLNTGFGSVQFAEMLARARSEAKFLAEFQLYALGDPEVGEALARVYAETFAGNAAFLACLPDLKPGVSPDRLAVTLQSLSIGFLVQSFLSPEAVTEAAIREAFEALADGVAAS